MVGLKYTLEGHRGPRQHGAPSRGSCSATSRFTRATCSTSNDPELELTRFRLLGTGFFRDVQLSLRRGTQRGYVVLVVDVVERNTLVVNDVWLGLSADVDPSGARDPSPPTAARR